MTGRGVHGKDSAKRRGGILPGRLRIAARRGVTLVELMISMLILTIVCIAWLQIIGIQSARKEARRREAVERLAGMMDAFLYCKSAGGVDPGYGYKMDLSTGSFEKDRSGKNVYPVFSEGESPIGYQLLVVKDKDSLPDANKPGVDWGVRRSNWAVRKWLVGKLYDRSGTTDDAGRPFFSLPVCIGM